MSAVLISPTNLSFHGYARSGCTDGNASSKLNLLFTRIHTTLKHFEMTLSPMGGRTNWFLPQMRTTTAIQKKQKGRRYAAQNPLCASSSVVAMTESDPMLIMR